MTIKDIKSEARSKLALNIHQSIAVYTVEFTVFVTLIALVIMSCLCLNTVNKAATIVMICYGIVLLLVAVVGSCMISFAMVDFYLASYKCKPYNVRRLGDALTRGGMTKIMLVSMKRCLLGFLLLLCLIVPGVIYLIRTSMANHLLIANPKMSASTALSASNKVMSGKTGSYFALCMSMIGWWLLGIATLGLGFIFISSYTNLIKTVYYKRNLQGDKNVYTLPPQPVSPVQYAPEPAVNARTVAPIMPQTQPAAQSADGEAERPVKIESPVFPIDTLAESDKAEMDAAIRDLGSEGAVVPEVPIMPVGTGTKSKTASHLQTANEDFGSHPLDGSDIVEVVKPLTTKDIRDADVMSQKIDAMFSNSQPREEVKHDYFNSGGRQNPNDFYTAEMQSEAPAESAPAAANAEADTDPGEPVMSDSEFAEFIRNFDVPSAGSEFKPLTRSAKSEETENTEPAAPPEFTPPQSAATSQHSAVPPYSATTVPHSATSIPHSATARPHSATTVPHSSATFPHSVATATRSSSMPPHAATPPHPARQSQAHAQESRFERLKREREERLKREGR